MTYKVFLTSCQPYQLIARLDVAIILQLCQYHLLILDYKPLETICLDQARVVATCHFKLILDLLQHWYATLLMCMHNEGMNELVVLGMGLMRAAC